jgi:hypothetical protein
MGAAATGCASAADRQTAPQARGAADAGAHHADRRALPLPARDASRPKASELVDRAIALRPAEREAMVVDEVLAGNVPDFERGMVPVTLTGGGHTGRVWVLPDYLAIGSDDDWVRIPMTVRSAKKIAHATRCVFPTRKIVDAIHGAAAVRISSPYMPPGRDMGSIEYFAAHHAAIEGRRRATGASLGDLVSGPKKDLVLSKRSLSEPGRTAIYGWFTDDGQPIQALSLVHDDKYVDYAHGVRLVLTAMEAGGESVEVLDALADPERAPLVSDEGSFDLRPGWELADLRR